MKHLLLVGALALLPTVAIAQESGCDRPDVEVAYKGVTLLVSPCQGPVQQFVIQETTVEDLVEGATSSVRLLTLISNGDSYDIYPTVFSEKEEGLFADLSVGDTLVMGKAAE